MGNKKTIFVLGTIGVLVYLLTPRVAAYFYRSTTDSIEIESKRKEYWELTDYAYKNNVKSSEIQKRRKELFLWMHVRDLQIDEGHDGLTLLEEWNELLEYWKLEDT